MNDQSPEQRRKTRVTFNGVNGATGRYGIQPLGVEKLVKEKVIAGWFGQPERDAVKRRTQAKAARFTLGSLFGDPTKIEDAGWGIIFPATAREKDVNGILEALAPLIEVRKNKYYKVFRREKGYPWSEGHGQSFMRFLQDNGAGVGSVNPNQIPYYLLLVGDPQSIPYQFQYDLDVQYVVGRVYFEQLEDYYNYAQSVAQAEDGNLSLPRKAAFFGPANPGDDATHLSSQNLIKPLAEFYRDDPLAKNLGFQVEYIQPEESTKQRLLSLMGGAETPALLFTASHGVEWPYGDERQGAYQGALLCQDWAGPESWDGSLDEKWFLSAQDISNNKNAKLHGLVAFHFACYGAGTPYWDDYAGATNAARPALTERPFLAALPKALLSCPSGGALAVIGHVERAWSYSFEWDDGGAQLEVFKETLNRLMTGKPVGFALDAMNERHAIFASSLFAKLDKLKNFPDLYDPYELAFEWISTNDARGYVLLGDPAARLPLAAPGTPEPQRQTLTLKSPKTGDLPEVLDPNSRPDPELSVSAQTGSSGAGGKGYQADKGEKSSVRTGTPAAPVAGTGTGDPQAEAPTRAKQPPVAPAGGGQAGGEEAPDLQAGLAGAYVLPTSPLLALAQLNRDLSPQRASAYGLREDIEKGMRAVVETLTSTFTTLANNLASFANDVTSLEIETYSVPDLKDIVKDEKGEYGKSLATSGKRVAWTLIKLDGDLTAAVPTRDGELDEALWSVHKDMVELAQANRTEMIRAATEALVRLIGR
jgi:hypothetical protein